MCVVLGGSGVDGLIGDVGKASEGKDWLVMTSALIDPCDDFLRRLRRFLSISIVNEALGKILTTLVIALLNEQSREPVPKEEGHT